MAQELLYGWAGTLLEAGSTPARCPRTQSPEQETTDGAATDKRVWLTVAIAQADALSA
jgi:hypothetical protein